MIEKPEPKKPEPLFKGYTPKPDKKAEGGKQAKAAGTGFYHDQSGNLFYIKRSAAFPTDDMAEYLASKFFAGILGDDLAAECRLVADPKDGKVWIASKCTQKTLIKDPILKGDLYGRAGFSPQAGKRFQEWLEKHKLPKDFAKILAVCGLFQEFDVHPGNFMAYRRDLKKRSELYFSKGKEKKRFETVQVVDDPETQSKPAEGVGIYKFDHGWAFYQICDPANAKVDFDNPQAMWHRSGISVRSRPVNHFQNYPEVLNSEPFRAQMLDLGVRMGHLEVNNASDKVLRDSLLKYFDTLRRIVGEEKYFEARKYWIQSLSDFLDDKKGIRQKEIDDGELKEFSDATIDKDMNDDQLFNLIQNNIGIINGQFTEWLYLASFNVLFDEMLDVFKEANISKEKARDLLIAFGEQHLGLEMNSMSQIPTVNGVKAHLVEKLSEVMGRRTDSMMLLCATKESESDRKKPENKKTMGVENILKLLNNFQSAFEQCHAFNSKTSKLETVIPPTLHTEMNAIFGFIQNLDCEKLMDDDLKKLQFYLSYFAKVCQKFPKEMSVMGSLTAAQTHILEACILKNKKELRNKEESRKALIAAVQRDDVEYVKQFMKIVGDSRITSAEKDLFKQGFEPSGTLLNFAIHCDAPKVVLELANVLQYAMYSHTQITTSDGQVYENSLAYALQNKKVRAAEALLDARNQYSYTRLGGSIFNFDFKIEALGFIDYLIQSLSFEMLNLFCNPKVVGIDTLKIEKFVEDRVNQSLGNPSSSSIQGPRVSAWRDAKEAEAFFKDLITTDQSHLLKYFLKHLDQIAEKFVGKIPEEGLKSTDKKMVEETKKEIEKNKKEIMKFKSDFCSNLIHSACQEGSIKSLNALLEFLSQSTSSWYHPTSSYKLNVSLLGMDKDRNPLCDAFRKGHFEILTMLFEYCKTHRGVDASLPWSQQDERDETLLHLLVSGDQTEEIQALFSEFATQMYRNSDYTACQKRDTRGYTPLHCMALNGNVDALKEICAKTGRSIDFLFGDALWNTQDKKANDSRNVIPSPLELAIFQGHQGMVEYLLEPTKLKAKTSLPYGSLMILAVHSKNLRILSILLKDVLNNKKIPLADKMTWFDFVYMEIKPRDREALFVILQQIDRFEPDILKRDFSFEGKKALWLTAECGMKEQCLMLLDHSRDQEGCSRYSKGDINAAIAMTVDTAAESSDVDFDIGPFLMELLNKSVELKIFKKPDDNEEIDSLIKIIRAKTQRLEEENEKERTRRELRQSKFLSVQEPMQTSRIGNSSRSDEKGDEPTSGKDSDPSKGPTQTPSQDPGSDSGPSSKGPQKHRRSPSQ